MLRLLAVLVALLALITSIPAAPIPKDDAKTPYYFSIRVGDTRVWAWDDSENEFTEVVTKVEDKNGEKLVTVKTTAGDYNSTEQYALNEKGLFRVSHNDFKYKQPWCVLKAPYKAGEKWEIDLTDYTGGKLKWTNALGKIEAVEVPAGKFQALRVEIQHTGQKPQPTAIAWYAPGIGQVKMLARSGDGSESAAVLKSFKPGKE